MWGVDPCGRPRLCRWQDEGHPQGMSSPPETEPHPTHHHPRPYGDEGPLSRIGFWRSKIFIRLKIRIDINIAISYRYLLHIKDRTGRSQRSILYQFVV